MNFNNQNNQITDISYVPIGGEDWYPFFHCKCVPVNVYCPRGIGTFCVAVFYQ